MNWTLCRVGSRGYHGALDRKGVACPLDARSRRRATTCAGATLRTPFAIWIGDHSGREETQREVHSYKQ
jgi:hypothetical protein